MTIEQIGKYEIEYEATELPEQVGWAAYVAIFGESDNSAHRKCVVERKRVGLESSFSSEETALAAAREHAVGLLEK